MHSISCVVFLSNEIAVLISVLESERISDSTGESGKSRLRVLCGGCVKAFPASCDILLGCLAAV
jgi:hypothetical protein